MDTSQKEFRTMSEYIAASPPGSRVLLKKLARMIGESVPEAEGTIRYGIPTFRLHGRNMVHFGAFKKHIGFYPTPSAIIAFKKDLSAYSQSKGAIRFPVHEPLPFALVVKMSKYRAKMIKSGKR